jgi:hypothetical protein
MTIRWPTRSPTIVAELNRQYLGDVQVIAREESSILISDLRW